MLLHELLTKQIKSLLIARTPAHEKNTTEFEWLEGGGYTLPKKWEKLGHGSQASTFLHTRSNTAVKVLYVEGTQDPAYQFLRL